MICSTAYSQKSELVHLEEYRTQWLSTWPWIKKWIFPNQQVHGTHVVHWLNHSKTETEEQTLVCDALITDIPNLGLGVWGSDCPGLAIFSPDGIRGIAHCGWKGTANELPTRLAHEISLVSHSPPESWVAHIGPGICGDCYEIDSPVINSYDWPENSIHLTKNGKAQLDIRTAIEAQCRQFGIEKISKSEVCTSESKQHHSYRAQGKGPNQLLVLFPNEESQ